MKKKIFLFFILQFSFISVFCLSGRLITPYFKKIIQYDYVVKGKIISIKKNERFGITAPLLQIEIIDNFGQEIGDTLWIIPINTYELNSEVNF
ncbi:MAG: hypothetical protein IPO21_13090 [Bacteroidales bacterium]|nr:hypothetical protein [Bacteroidales bacterium]